MRVYRIPWSTNVERVALALAHKGLSVEWVDIDAADRAPVVAVSGQELVPVLVADDGEVVADSTRIVRWLEARQPEPPLYPRDAARRAELHTFEDWFNGVWKRPPNRIEAELRKPEPDRARIAAWTAELTASLDRFEALLDGRDFLFGDTFGAADVCAFPFVKYAAIAVDPGDVERFHHILRDSLPLAHPRVEAWIARVDALPRA